MMTGSTSVMVMLRSSSAASHLIYSCSLRGGRRTPQEYAALRLFCQSSSVTFEWMYPMGSSGRSRGGKWVGRARQKASHVYEWHRRPLSCGAKLLPASQKRDLGLGRYVSMDT
ncbi:hypothetical protein B0H12DRAFT_1107426 [Mycena haematopus]|nr:hypothetical protein B0H12DRAFT_1107426 [Mycena haematopus]